MEIRSRYDAAKLRLRRYFTGRPCCKGHVSERYTINGTCCECAITRSTEAHREIREALHG